VQDSVDSKVPFLKNIIPVVDLTIGYGKVYIAYSYNVLRGEFEFSNYPLGKYTLESSPAATAIIRSLKDSAEQPLRKYFEGGHVRRVDVTGFADAVPVSDKCKYQGEFGNPLDNSRIKIRTGENIGTNHRLAMLRGIGAKQNLKRYFDERFPGIECRVGAQTSEEEGYQGGEYRKVRIEVVIKDTFKNLPKTHSPPPKSYTLAVLPVISEDIEEKYKWDLASELQSAIEEPGITVVEREHLDKVIDELKLNMSDHMAPNKVRTVGKQIGAKKLVWSLITAYPESKWSIRTKIVDVETGISIVVPREENPVTASLSQLGRYVKEDGKSVVHWLRNYFHPQSTPSPNRLK